MSKLDRLIIYLPIALVFMCLLWGTAGYFVGFDQGMREAQAAIEDRVLKNTKHSLGDIAICYEIVREK